MKQITKRIMALVLVTCMTLSIWTIQGVNAASESKTFKVLTYNIAGLPKALAGNDLGYHNTPEIGQLINEYDIVGVQEDFSYHDVLLENARFPYYSNWSGDVPIGDILDLDWKNLIDFNGDIGEGLNVFSNFPMQESKRYSWRSTYGWTPDTGADKYIPKGFTYNKVEVAPDVYIDVYNLHGDAGFDDGSCAARGDNMKELGEYIKKNSIGNAVIVMGDTNAYHHRKSDGIRENLLAPNVLKDPWIELVRGGEFPESTDQWKDLKMWEKDTDPNVDRNTPDYEPVDKIFYRSGNGINLQAISYQPEEEKFLDANGERLSDHYAWSVEFEYTLKNGMPNQVYLSELATVDGYNGYGPVEADRAVGGDNAFDGGGLTIGNQSFSKGLGTHANSELVYDLNGEYNQFKSYVGLHDYRSGSVNFQVWGDNSLLFDSGIMRKGDPAKFVNISIAGVDRLTLKALDAGDGKSNDHANWGEAQIIKDATGLEAAPIRINDDDPNIIYREFNHVKGRQLDYKGDVHQTTNPSASVSYIFYGTGIDYIGAKNQDIANQTVLIDGVVSTINAYAPNYQGQQTLFSARNLPLGEHVITVLKGEGNWMVVDGFNVYNPSDTSPKYLSDLAWETASSGYGPVEVDRTNGDKGMADGGPIKLSGVTYNKGLGVHANSEIVYKVNKKYNRFKSDIGIQDGLNGGSIKFEVWGDQTKLYDSGEMYKDTPKQSIDVDISNVERLILKVIDFNGNNRVDHGNWANARVE